MKLAIDDLEIQTFTDDEILNEITIIPRKLGFCSNVDGRGNVCGRSVCDQDVDSLDLPQRRGRTKYICGSCLETLLFGKKAIQGTDSHKNSKTAIKHRDSKPRLPERKA